MNSEHHHDEQHDNGSAKRRSARRTRRADAPSPTAPVRMAGANALTYHRSGAAAGQSNQSNAFNLPFVLGVLRQWWKVTTPLGLLLAVAVAGVMWWLFEPMYEAQAWLRIEDRRPYIAFPTKDDSNRFVSTQVAMIRSPLVIGPAVGQPEVQRVPEIGNKPDPISWLGKQIQVKSVGDSELFLVSYAGPNPQDAQTIVNAVVDAFIVLRGNDEASRMQEIINLLTSEQDLRESKVDELRNKVQKMTKDATGKDPFAAVPESPFVHDPLSELQLQLSDAEVKRTIAEVQYKACEKSIASTQMEVPDAVIADAVEDHPDVQEVKAAIANKMTTLDEYEKTLVGGKEHVRHKELAETLERDKQRLVGVRQRVGQQIRVEMRTGWQSQREAELAGLAAQVKDYKLLEEALQTLCDESLGDRKESSSISLDLELARIELLRAQEVRNRIADRIDTMKTEQRAPERVDLQQEAQLPKAPVEVLPVNKIGLLSLALFFFPLSMAVGWELLIKRVGDADRLAQDIQVPVIGEIARLPTRQNRFYGFGGANTGRGTEVFEESIDSLRTTLVLAEKLEHMKVILVTSAISGEGKTSVAVQLAVSLARASGKRTLLVDADMRAPDIHALLDLSLEPGLVDVLTGDCSLEEAVQVEFSDSVHVLTAGRAHTSPHRLVGNGTLKPMFAELRAKYDYIVLDSPPVLAVSEALVLARQADASLICAMRDISRVDQVRRACDRLMGAGATPAGVVLNGVPIDTYARRYGTYGYVRS